MLTQVVQNINFSIILHAHISALIATMGDVNAAVERLLGGGLQVKAFVSLSCLLNNPIFMVLTQQFHFHCLNSTISFSGAEPWVKLFLCDGLEAILVTRRWARIK